MSFQETNSTSFPLLPTLFSSGAGLLPVLGNHAVARAMVETGTRVITSYPGSPTPEIAGALLTIDPAQRPFYFEYSTNEKVALEIAAGAAINGHLSCVFFKSVGLNVASDSLIQQGLFNLPGGLVVLLGDDPGAHSSQNEQDNRHFARMSYIPMLEPASPDEAYRMYKEAVRLAKLRQSPVFLRMTTHVCHARQTVRFDPCTPDFSPWESRYDAVNGRYFPVTRSLFPLKRAALARLDQFSVDSDESVFNVVHPGANVQTDPPARRGIICAGAVNAGVLEHVESARAPVTVFSLGFTFPLPAGRIREFLNRHGEVLIIEELDRVLETEIKALAFDAGCRCRVISRPTNEDRMGELNLERLGELLYRIWPDAFPAPSALAVLQEDAAPERSAQLCPGCGHRSAFFALQQVLPVDAITVGDIGCITLGALPPHNLGRILFSMGHSVSTAAGLALRNETRKVVAFMGDGTFFHAGLPGLINAVTTNANIVLYLLDNGTTAMTGHQHRPGSGEVGPKISIPDLLNTLGVTFVRQADAYDQAALREHLTEAMNTTGFSVVIASHPCMLQFMSARKKKNPDFVPSTVEIDPARCDKQLTCISAFGCPAFARAENGDIRVNPDICIGCGSCMQICPSNAIIRRKKS